MRRHRTPTQRITVQPLSVRARRRVALRALCFALTASLVPLALTIAASPARATQLTDDAGQTTASTQGQQMETSEMESQGMEADEMTSNDQEPTDAESGQAAAAEAPPADPCASPEHHQFDFWIGDWEVLNADDTPAGTNQVTTLYGGCVLQEHWQGAGGSVGTSFSLYNAPRGVWHQTWVDGQGGLLLIEGGLDGKDMVLSGRQPSSKDPSVEVLHEVRWTPLDDGRVRQHWRASKDDGKTWVTLFDGYYSKKGS